MSIDVAPQIITYRYARCLRFRAERLDDYEKLEATVMYLGRKILERFKGRRVSYPLTELFEQDGDNIIKDLITLRISFDVQEADTSVQNGTNA